MPNESGIDTYNNLSNIDPNVDVIFMSGIGDPDALDSIPAGRTCSFIKKPFSLDEITKKVTQRLHSKIINSVTNLPN